METEIRFNSFIEFVCVFDVIGVISYRGLPLDDASWLPYRYMNKGCKAYVIKSLVKNED